MPLFKPVYIETSKKGLLAEKVEKAYEILESCTLCPRRCKADRLSGETGICKTGEKAYVSSFNSHFGEEDPLVGTHGSGTIFFTHCNLLCIFCQNYDISHLGHGEQISNEKLADIMMHLQNAGCHNINFVTPSHVVPQILSAVEIAVDKGLSVPLVYNTGGYDRVETLKLRPFVTPKITRMWPERRLLRCIGRQVILLPMNRVLPGGGFWYGTLFYPMDLLERAK